MRVAIVGGTAGLGYGLAVRLARAGAEVLIGSRQEEKAVTAADEVAAKAGGSSSVAGGQNPAVVGDAEVVVVAVPFPGQAAIYRSIREKLTEGTPVCDCTVPLASEVGGKATRLLGVWEGSAAEQARGILGRDFPLASGFHTVSAGALESPDEEVGDVLVCGDETARQAVRKMVELLGEARFVDCGPLESARLLEGITPLLIGINKRYQLSPGAGIRITRLEG